MVGSTVHYRTLSALVYSYTNEDCDSPFMLRLHTEPNEHESQPWCEPVSGIDVCRSMISVCGIVGLKYCVMSGSCVVCRKRTHLQNSTNCSPLATLCELVSLLGL